MNWKFGIAVLALVLAGCAGSPYDIARKHDALRDYQGADAGFFVASSGAIKGSIFSNSSVTFRRRDTEDLVSIGYTPKRILSLGGEPADFESSKDSGIVIVKRLPPGEYEIQSAQGVQYGTYEYRCTKRLAPVVRFTVHAGEVVYLGRYVVTSWRGNCLALAISDEQQSDVAVAKTRVPALPTDAVHSNVPAVEQRRQ